MIEFIDSLSPPPIIITPYAVGPSPGTAFTIHTPADANAPASRSALTVWVTENSSER